MNNYNYEHLKDEWEDKIETIKDRSEQIAKRIYSTMDYYYACWEIARHGILLLDFKGRIIDANPFFCEKINYQRSELIGKNINDFCVQATDLYNSDSINILTLLQSINQQTTNQCQIKTKEKYLYRVRWVANRIPNDLNIAFSHSLIHVYFLGETNYSEIINQIDKLKKKESHLLWKVLDSLYIKIALLLIIILTALGGSLPTLVSKLIDMLQ